MTDKIVKNNILFELSKTDYGEITANRILYKNGCPYIKFIMHYDGKTHMYKYCGEKYGYMPYGLICKYIQDITINDVYDL